MASLNTVNRSANKKNNQKIYLVLPAYNEAEALPSLINKVRNIQDIFGLPIETIVVNDGSSDNTLKVSKNLKVSVVDLQPNRGLAGALRAGLAHAISVANANDIVVTMDADDSHDPGLIFRMRTQILEGSDLVIASRYRTGSRIVGLNWVRVLMSSGAGWLFRIFAPIKGVRDYTCGYRAYRVELLQKMFSSFGENLIEQKGFACMAEVLLKTRRFNPVIHELPFILRYDQKPGESKMKILNTVVQTLSLILKSRRYK